MTRKLLSVSLLLCLFILANASPGVAREKVNDDVIAELLEEGWTILGDGVLRRELRAGEVEHFVFGVRGFTWKLQDLRLQYRRLLETYNLTPTPELKRTIANHRKEINSTMQMIRRARAAEKQGLEDDLKIDCSVKWSYNAGAGWRTDAAGVWANASASFNGTCGFTGEVYAYATGTVTRAAGPYSESVTDGPRSGANVTASAAVSITGSEPCSSYAYASVTSNNLNPSSYSMAASNDRCPPQVVVTISGPSLIDLSYSTCVTGNWSSAVTGATGAVTYSWTIDGVQVGTASTFSKSICQGQYAGGFTLKVRATDVNSGIWDEDSRWVDVFEGCSDPCLCTSPTEAIAPPPPCY